jgi:hypothetical protein
MGSSKKRCTRRRQGALPISRDLGRVLKLQRALYGLRQAPRAWHIKLAHELIARGFEPSDADPSLWILRGPTGAVFTMIYVDDGLVAARTAAEADALVDLVAGIFEIRALGEPRDFLGIRITRDRQARTIQIDQADKAAGLAEVAGVSGQTAAVPMSPEVFGALHKSVDGETLADRVQYQTWLGSLLHLAQCTRPDIAQAVGALASYGSAPSVTHLKALVMLIRYVGGTAQRGITYGRSSVPVRTWCDANYAACVDSRRSTTGWVVVMYGGAVSWLSQKQHTVANSTMEAEYQSCGSVAREALSLRKQLTELALLSKDFPLTGPLSIFCDNKAAMVLCSDRKEGARSKHIDIIHHFARARVARGEVSFVYCPSSENCADCLTKALPRAALESNLVGLGMLPSL